MITKQCLEAAKVANTGRKRIFSEEHRLHLSIAAKNRISKMGKNSNNWKGSSVGYKGLHQRINKQLGSPSFCEHCKSTSAKAYDWANKSGSYLEDIADWIRLCRSCHMIYDKKGFKASTMYTYNGKTMGLADWAKETGIKFFTLYSRVRKYNMPIEQALEIKR